MCVRVYDIHVLSLCIFVCGQYHTPAVVAYINNRVITGGRLSRVKPSHGRLHLPLICGAPLGPSWPPELWYWCSYMVISPLIGGTPPSSKISDSSNYLRLLDTLNHEVESSTTHASSINGMASMNSCTALQGCRIVTFLVAPFPLVAGTLPGGGSNSVGHSLDRCAALHGSAKLH